MMIRSIFYRYGKNPSFKPRKNVLSFLQFLGSKLETGVCVEKKQTRDENSV